MGEMKERMLRGELYIADDPGLAADNARAQALLERFNATGHEAHDERAGLLRELLGSAGEGVVDQAAVSLRLRHLHHDRRGTFVNYGCVLLDCAQIVIGAACQIATGVQPLTPTHPIDPGPRRSGWEAAEPITLGDNVWLGGGVIVCPGVTIGEDTVVGAGAVVTRDLPSGVVAVGNPARVLREIGPADRVEVPRLDG